MSDTHTTDILVIGAGIAGASIAARLVGHARVHLIEMEDRPGYHATGRSAANYEPTYGPPIIRQLTAASLAYFERPPDGLAEVPLLSPRGVVMLGGDGDDALVQEALDAGYVRSDFAACKVRLPLLRAGTAVHYLIDDSTRDLDVDALHRGFLKLHKRSGGGLTCRTRLAGAVRADGVWRAETSAGRFEAPILVNAAGAWADEIAGSLGLLPLGLIPKRRSAAIVAVPGGLDARAWPQVGDLKDSFYTKPMGGALMLSPSEAVPAPPHDAYADDLALAEAVEAYQAHMDHEVTRIDRSWGGLRTFAPDGNPVIGFDPRAEGLFWTAGQGGYGIQTAPAWSALAADLLLHRQAPDGRIDPGRFVV